MADIIIQDSGFLNPTNTGTKASSGDMANSGNAITLCGVSFVPFSRANLDNSPRIGVYATGTEVSSGSEIHLGSVENMGFVINGVLDLSVTAHQNLVVPLNQLPRTKWYKLLYFDSVGSDANNQLLYQLSDDTFTAGEQTSFSLSAAYKHLHVFISEVNFNHSTAVTNKVTFSIRGFVTKKETSTI